MNHNNALWLQQQDDKARAERVLELTLDLHQDVRLIQQSEVEAATLRHHALLMRARTFGYAVADFAALQVLLDTEAFWPLDTGKAHRCRKSACTILSFAPGSTVQRLDMTGVAFVARGHWYICAETGQMHECTTTNKCSAMSIVKGDVAGVTIGYNCVISGLSKPVPRSSGAAWNGTTFYSRNVLQEIENRLDAAERDEIGGQEYGGDVSDAEEMLSEEVDEDEDAVAPLPDDDDDEEEPAPKRLCVKPNDTQPFTTMQATFSLTSVEALAQHLAEMELQAREAQLEQMRAHLEHEKRSMPLGSVGRDRKMRRAMRELRQNWDVIQEKRKGQGDYLKKRNSRREAVSRTPEEKVERCLAKASVGGAEQVVEALLHPDVRTDIVRAKLRLAAPVADAAVATLRQSMREVPLMAQVAVWRRSVCEQLGFSLVYSVEPVSTEQTQRYVEIMLAHWRLAASSAYVTDQLEGHKKKKRRPLDFTLFCIGVLYMMGNGGETVHLKFETLPPQCTGGLLKKLREGVVVAELPDEREYLGARLLPVHLLCHLRQIYDGRWNFNNNTANEAIAMVRACNEARYRSAKQAFVVAVENMPEHTDDNHILAEYKLYLEALRPAHSVHRRWPPSTFPLTSERPLEPFATLDLSSNSSDGT